MSDGNETGGFLASLGETVGGFVAGIPAALGSFFGGVGEGAGVHGVFDWIALLMGIALLLTSARGIRAGRILGPALRGVIGVALMGWAVT